MKRKRLAELVREEAGDLQEAPAPREERPREAPHGGGLEGSPPGEGQAERPLPPYLTYVRKECRLRPDQLDALTALARRLNRERRGKGERITENTLIRLAVDNLMKLSYEEIILLIRDREPNLGG
ncbi:hypothetical protein TthSNM66_24250 (plasmid) [Thermus thermophilus]|uniref:ATPase n=1 Tax=Thermus thermophilus TaxID=274 RepID=UPI001FCB1439|nr:ATPase [Thermus thermophilus]BDG27789.1 hypothetical protein TthSNM66_24250 [Thermus thermophilus]